ncbi:MAG: hypothetical protein AAF727_04845 [Pseudomonadota bacterium]
MKRTHSKPVLGVLAPAVAPTPLCAALVAAAIAIPVGIVLQVLDLLLF